MFISSSINIIITHTVKIREVLGAKWFLVKLFQTGIYFVDFWMSISIMSFSEKKEQGLVKK